MEIKKIGKNILDSNPYKVIIKPALNITTSGFYDVVDQFANAIFSNRKNEFINFLNDNYELLQDEEILKNQHFISCLGILYQEIIKQRFEWKRLRIYGIFLGFINEKDKEDFELERMFNTLNLMCFEDYQELMDWMDIELDDIFSNTDGFANLIGLGLLCNHVKYINSELSLGKSDDNGNIFDEDIMRTIQDNLNDNIGREIKMEYKLSNFGKKLIKMCESL